MRRSWTMAVVAAVAAGGCQHPTIRPMPGVLPSAGMLLRAEPVRLSADVQLYRFELLASDVGNDLYPLNVSRAVPGDRLVSKLYVFEKGRWRFADFVIMLRARNGDSANISPDGKRLVYERPDVSEAEGPWPRAYPRDRRGRRVTIRHVGTGQSFVSERFTEVYGLGASSHWRGDGEELAFTTTCVKNGKPVRQLVVADACGSVLLDAEAMPALAGLEFIGYSPDGDRVAALRPAAAAEMGRQGGELVELDVAARTLREAGKVPARIACLHAGRYDRIIEWDDTGRCRLGGEAAAGQLTRR